jgi:hypothetical protein
MSGFRNVVGSGAVVGVLALVGCGGTGGGGTAPSPATTYTETFSGTVTQNAIDYGPPDSPHHFTVHQAGNLDATLTDIQPLNTITLGLGLGVWDNTAQTCTVQLSSAAAKLNLTLSASVGVAGELCVGVSDVGNITADGVVTYTVTVTHT